MLKFLKLPVLEEGWEDEETLPDHLDTSDFQAIIAWRKENKRKRFRVSGLFSLKRTPSGKWPRRRKTTSSSVNGTRPTSCPEPQNEAGAAASPARPQSLFLEELEIHEDDTKIETVDLSDHEQEGKSKPKTSKASGDEAPKAPPKTKGRRGSKKQSSLKKKKQEKRSSKKEKKSKSKQKASTSEAEDATTSGTEAEALSPSEVTPDLADKSKSVEAPETADEPIACLTAAEERKSSSLASDLTQQVLAHIDAKSKVEKSEELGEDVKKDLEREEDLDAVASSIVAETMDIAQMRLNEEGICYGENAVEVHATLSPTEVESETLASAEEVSGKPSDHQAPVVEETIVFSTDKHVEATPPAVEAVICPLTQITQESSPSPQAPPRRRQSATQPVEAQPTSAPAVAAEHEASISLSQSTEVKLNTENEEISKTSETTMQSNVVEQPSIGANVVEKVEENIQQLLPEAPVNSPSAPVVSILTEDPDAEPLEASLDKTTDQESAKASLPTEHFNEAAVDVGAEVAAVSATVAAIGGEVTLNGTNEVKETVKEKLKTASVSSESDKQSKSDASENKRLEKERLKKEKEAEKAKEKERLKEEKRKKAEQKAAEKEKNKSDKKIKMPKRLSSLFHKKDKQLKQVAEVDVDSPSTSSAVSQQTKEPEKADTIAPQAVETMVCPLDQAKIEEDKPEDDTRSSGPNLSVSVDVSVEPLSIATNSENSELCPDSQPVNGDLSCTPPQSPPLESPLSDETKTPGSDTSEPTSPGSDCELNGSNGGSNVLKKISLGPRLRTAILRKKSSGASDSGVERTVSLTTPKSVAESVDVTPPPRKLRPRKPVEQYSPVTLGAHNPVPSDATTAGETIEEHKDILNTEIGANGDTLVENVAVEVSTASGDLKKEAVLCVDSDDAKINTEIQSDLSKTDLETENIDGNASIEDKHNTPGLESQAGEETSVMNCVLDNVTAKLNSTAFAAPSEELSHNENMHQPDTSQTCSFNSQSEISEMPVASESSLVVEPIIEASTKPKVSCEFFSPRVNTKDIVSDFTVSSKDDSDIDDTDPSQLQTSSNHHQQQQQIEQPQKQRSQHSGSDDDEEESETFSSLQSPTLVSTATIVLRPSSVDDTCPEAETPMEEWIVPAVKKVKTTSTSVQTEYAKGSLPVSAGFLSNVSVTPSKTDEDENKSLRTEDTGNLLKEVQSIVVSDHQTEKDAEKSENADVICESKDVVTVDEDSGEATKGLLDRQVYTTVCLAQVRNGTKEDTTSQKPVDEDMIIASSKPRAAITIAEYMIGTLEENSAKDAVSTDTKETVESNQAKESDPNPASKLPEQVTETEDSFFADDGSRSADITITEDAPGCSTEEFAKNQPVDHSSEESEGSGQRTPTPTDQHDTVESVINGIVNEAVNGVLHGEHLEKADESMESDKSPPSSPKPRETDDSNMKMISLESSLVTESSVPSVDHNKNATKSDGNDDTPKEKSNIKESITKPSPTETIEAYLKLQYQEAGETISAPFVNGEKGFEENGNALITAPDTALEVQEEQQITG
ncbi:hypothetical protein ElyMa_005798400 [Elysia marginata]|uniref:Uncharacterized protein n=1 Tax=Elysia marginata TaxID=1093978 RepID=A0AAV4FTH4_9GAST|nr:hypothetical protein ElyMa_005798400 [Elysia marginata]